MPADVLRVQDLDVEALRDLLDPYALKLTVTPPGEAIPGSYWGEAEAGLLADTVFARPDTPIHSVLHEGAHFVCMDAERRKGLQQDAGGDYDEENAVCYLQILWADALAGFSRQRMWADMDAWGYTFRLGSAQQWFEHDADDAREWLQRFGIIDERENLTGKRREDPSKLKIEIESQKGAPRSEFKIQNSKSKVRRGAARRRN